jgi:hypothetical protein
MLFSLKCLFRTLLFTLIQGLFSTGNTWARWSDSPSSITVAGFLQCFLFIMLTSISVFVLVVIPVGGFDCVYQVISQQ